MTPRYVDVHSHVVLKDYDRDLPEVLSRMEEEGVWTITVGVDRATSEAAVKFAESREGFFATVGLHPTDTTVETFAASEYRDLIAHPKTVGIGECGIDYFRLSRGNEKSPDLSFPRRGKEESSAYYRLTGDSREEKKRQWREFEKQVEAAVESDKPLMLHCRPTKGTVDTYVEVLNYLEPLFREKGERLRGNSHFFVGDLAVAKRFWDMGFTTSFTGVLTFARDYDEVVRNAPRDLILTETDAPFAAPEPFRGKRNEPLYVKYVVQAIARIRNEDPEDVREATVRNALRVFSLTPHT